MIVIVIFVIVIVIVIFDSDSDSDFVKCKFDVIRLKVAFRHHEP